MNAKQQICNQPTSTQKQVPLIVQSYRGLFINADMIKVNKAQFFDQFTLSKEVYKGKQKIFSFFNLYEGYLRIPIFLPDKNDIIANLLSTNNIDLNSKQMKMNTIHTIDYEYIGEPKLYQLIAAKYLIKNIYNESRRKAGKASCITVMDTGLGKTHLAMLIINILKVRTLIVVPPSSILLEQWKEDLNKFSKHEGTSLTLGLYDAKHKDLNADILLIMSNNLMNPKEDLSKALSKFALVIYDEVHCYATRKQSNMFTYTSNHYRLGMTATPNYGFQKYLQYELGEVIDAKTIPYFDAGKVSFEGVVYVLHYYGKADYTRLIQREDGSVNNTEMYNAITSDIQRNKLALKCVKWLLNKGVKSYVFFIDKMSLFLFERLLIEQKVVEEKYIVQAKGGMSIGEMADMRNTAKVILIIYAYGDKGLSINDVFGEVWYHPRKTLIRQKTGRIFRMNSDQTAIRYIFDINDANTIYTKQLSYRIDDYIDRCLTIQHMYIKSDEVDEFVLA